MAVPYLVPCLVHLREQFNHEFPDRAKGADGWIGDAAHQSGTSDHNPNAQGAVRAIDITTDLARPGVSLWDVCEMLRGNSRLEYIIHMRKIASRSQGWTWHTYTGTDPHTNHAHFSARHDGSGWNNVAPWGVEDIVTKSEFMSWMTEWAKSSNGQVALGVNLDDKIGDTANLNRTVGDVLRDVAKLRGVLVGDTADTANAKLSPTSPLAQLITAAADIGEITAVVVPPTKP
jgi:hypothetical protein